MTYKFIVILSYADSCHAETRTVLKDLFLVDSVDEILKFDTFLKSIE